jgi:hypothetical protein
MRPTIAKLAASPVLTLKTKPRFRSDLLQDQTWPQDVNYLRDTYNDIILIWEELKEPETDKLLYQRTEPKLRELVESLMEVSTKVPYLSAIRKLMMNARHDFEIASMYSRAGDYASATLYQSYSLIKIHDVLETMTRFGSTPAHQRNAFIIDKKAYGYDISGEVFDGSGEMANRENEETLNDTAQPQDHHETAPNPANLTRDVDADEEFPELQEFKNKRVSWPPRTR